MIRRVLLIGATGTFGAKLARHLSKLDSIELILTSRNVERAGAAAAELVSAGTKCYVSGLAFDYGRASSDFFSRLKPFLVIDASGPFQAADFKLARTAIESGAHWIDLADARGHILNFSASLDALARAKGVTAYAGASSTPALSTAVVADLTKGWQRIDTATFAIFPAGDGPAGPSVIRAVLSYAGQPIPVWRSGRLESELGWGRLTRRSVRGLGNRITSPVETADADLVSQLFSVQSRVSFEAGLESRVEHLGLFVLAKLRSARWLGDLSWLTRPLELGRGITRLFSSGNSGMTVNVTGLGANGKHQASCWTLIAKQSAGPNVPVLPALALTRRLLSGDYPPGATPASGTLTLSEIEAEMRSLPIETSQSTNVSTSVSLVEMAIGKDAYGALPEPLQAFHSNTGAPVWSGMANVEAGTGLLARIIGRVFGFPPSDRDVPVTVTVDRRGGRETWTRDFGGRRFFSVLAPAGRGQVAEAFGPFRILLKLASRDGAILMPVAGWKLGWFPLPRRLAPRSETREYCGENGRFGFDVRISAPFVGLIAHYKGWLEPGARQFSASA